MGFGTSVPMSEECGEFIDRDYETMHRLIQRFGYFAHHVHTLVLLNATSVGLLRASASRPM